VTMAQFFVGSANAAGSTASGTVNQTGGTLTETNPGVGFFCIGGRASTNGVGIYNISGGTLNAAAGIRVGSTGVGTMTVSGTAVVNANGGFNTARIGGSSGTLNLNGGTVNTFNLASSTSVNCTNHFNGSLVSPTTNSTAWVSGLAVVDIRNGGALFNTAGWNVTNTQAFLHSVVPGDNAIDGGVTKSGAGLLCLAGADTYTGNTTVNGGTLEIAQPTLYGNSTVSVASGAVLQLDFLTTNTVAGFVTNGVAAGSGVYNSANSSGYLTGAGSLLVPATGPGTFTSMPRITNFTMSGANVVMTVSNAQANAAYYLLASTNLALPLYQWRTVATNVPATGGSFTFIGTNAVTAGAALQFYGLSNTNYNH